MVSSLSSVWHILGALAIPIVLIVVLFLFAWYVGRGPFIALVSSLYIGYALYALFPYASLLPTAPALTALFSDLAVFAILSALAYLVLRRTASSEFISMGAFGLAVLCVLATGLILALLYHVFPTRTVYAFTPLLNLLFVPKIFFYWWFIAPLVGLFVLAR